MVSTQRFLFLPIIPPLLSTAAPTREGTNMPKVLSEFRDAIGFITLDHPRKHNAPSTAFIDDLVDALAELKRQQARTAILRAPRYGPPFILFVH